MKKILFLLTATFFSLATHIQAEVTWNAPVTISTPLVNASDPRVVIDANGNATAVWIESGVVQASTLPFGGSWSAPTAISNVSNTSSNPRLRVDASGNVTALWIENTLIKSSLQPFGSGWGTAATVSGSGATTPSLVVDSFGNAVALWIRSGFIESATRASGTWSLVAVISASGATNPTLAISDSGKAMAIWHATSSGSDLLVSDILTISTNTWAATRNLFAAQTAFSHDYPRLALDASGNATVLWFRFNNQAGVYKNVQVLTSSLASGGTSWVLATILSNAGIRNPADLSSMVKYDVNGNVFAMWTNSYDGSTYSIESARQLSGSAWNAAAQPQVPSIYSFSFDTSITSGTALLANTAWDGASLFIYTQESDMQNPIFQAWSIGATVSTGTENGSPRCACAIASGAFQAVSVWINNDGTTNTIQASHGSDTIIAPPTGVSATQNSTNLGVYTDYYNTITWTASTDPTVVQYNLYRNGIFFNAVTPDTLQIVDHNATQGGTVTYGVAALTSSFRQSSIATFTLVP